MTTKDPDIQTLLEKYLSYTKPITNNDNTTIKRSKISRWDWTKYIKKKITKNEILHNPLEFSWQITKKCNLSCKYCYSDHKSKDELTTDECFIFIDDIHKIKACEVTIEGGEPFLRNDIFDILTYLKKKNIFIDILTNGLLIDTITAKDLSNILNIDTDGIQISLDSIDPEVNKQLYGKVIYEDVISKIELLLANNINTRINVVLTEKNFVEIPKIYTKMLDLGVRGGFSITPISQVGGGKYFNLPPISESIKMMLKVKSLETTALPVTGFPGFYHGLSSYKKALKNLNLLEILPEEHICDCARSKININSNGDVYPCAFLQYDRFKLGNIKENSILSIWRNEKTDEYRKFAMQEKCSGCDNYDICTIRCIGALYSSNKHLKQKDPRCMRVKRMFNE